MQHDTSTPQTDTTEDATAAAEATTPVAGDELASLREQLAQANDKYLRLAAEYDNYRRRTIKERGEERARAQAELAKLLLDPLDDLNRFAAVDVTSTTVPMMVEGAALVARKVFKELSAGGLQVIEPTGQPFDPALHEAVSTQPAPSAEQDETVGVTYQVGYSYNGQLLRPARVVVLQWQG
ncbi:MAG: nucleotide exchange factor GrpE [Gemmatimonadaceae bacterium]|jgi:molecular chaperone GrpE|nr:nucleotide exchange factor GrpE [Gemmatimonadaceae bacterium]